MHHHVVQIGGELGQRPCCFISLCIASGARSSSPGASLADVIRPVVDWTLEHGSAAATAALPRGDVALVRATKIHGMSSTST